MSDPAPKTLVGKLAEVMQGVTRVPKTGKNTFFNYEYVTESDLTEALRPKLAAAGIMLIPNVVKTTRIETTNAKGNRSFITDVEVNWIISDGGDVSITVMVPGCSEDSGDKGLYKAITGSEKYLLKNLFLISTGDDPEKDGNGESHPAPLPDRLPQPPASYQNAKEAQAVASESQETGVLHDIRASQDGKAWFMKLGPLEGLWTRDADLATSLVKIQGQNITAHLRSKKPGSYQIISFIPAE